MKFNTITYSVMGILLRHPRTGYDVVKDLQSFRPAKSSQIYPILAKLQQHGHATCEVHPQIGRPDKKLYKLTHSGKALLSMWLDTDPEPPVTRDDFLSMLFSAWSKGPKSIVRLLTRRKEYLIRYQHDVRIKYETLVNAFPSDCKDPTNSRFSSALLYRRRIGLVAEELRWCLESLDTIESTM
jgi:DNA-binding PadR family transcriptional regulator